MPPFQKPHTAAICFAKGMENMDQDQVTYTPEEYLRERRAAREQAASAPSSPFGRPPAPPQPAPLREWPPAPPERPPNTFQRQAFPQHQPSTFPAGQGQPFFPPERQQEAFQQPVPLQQPSFERPAPAPSNRAGQRETRAYSAPPAYAPDEDDFADEYIDDENDDANETIAEEQMDEPSANPHNRPPSSRPGKGAVRALSLLCIILLIACAVLYFLQSSRNFQRTEAYAAAWRFTEAQQYARGLPPFYPDAATLQAYIAAGVSMEENDFAAARGAFSALSGFKDSGELELECTYRLAQTLAESGSYAEAREAFLSLGAYAEAPQWAHECSYREGLALYEQLAGAASFTEQAAIGKQALGKFIGLDGHPYAEEMLRRTSAFLYDGATTAFAIASQAFNQPASVETASAADAPPADASVFDEAYDVFAAIEHYQDSAQYLALILAVRLPQSEAAAMLRDQWDFAPARAFVLGRYIQEFFYGRWSGGGYGIEFNDTHRFFMLAAGEGETDFGNGGISTDSATGWKTAYSFRILGRDTIEVITTKTYTLNRVAPAAQPSAGDASIPSSDSAAP